MMQGPIIQQLPQHGGMINNQQQKRKEIYRYTAPHDLYSCSWSSRPEPHLKFRLAVGSFIEEYNNKVNFLVASAFHNNETIILF